MLAARHFGLIVREGRLGTHAREEITNGAEHGGSSRDRREIPADLEPVTAESLLCIRLATMECTRGRVVGDEHEVGMVRTTLEDARAGRVEHHVKSRAPIGRVADLLFDDEPSVIGKRRDERARAGDRVERDDPFIGQEGSHQADRTDPLRDSAHD